jgi:hypothetical protein
LIARFRSERHFGGNEVSTLKQGRSLQDLLDSQDITIHYNPVQQPPPEYEGTGMEGGYTLQGDTHNIWMDPHACHMGRWQLASGHPGARADSHCTGAWNGPRGHG